MSTVRTGHIPIVHTGRTIEIKKGLKKWRHGNIFNGEY